MKNQNSPKRVEYIRNNLLSKTTDAEKAAMKNIMRLGYRVVKQKPIHTGRKLYFADLYISELNLIIEIDGGYHYSKNQKRKDTNRSAGIWKLGYHVVRLCNRDARDIRKVAAKIRLIERRKGK